MVLLRARTVAIVGAGPSGLVAAKYFRAEKAFDKIVIFEQRGRIGGIWNYTPDQRDEDLFTVPQTDPAGRNQEPTWREVDSQDGEEQEQNGVKKEASFLSPLYERLETNIPRGLMGFQDLDWPQDSQLFPKHETVLEYIEEYGRDVKHMVLFETQVVDVRAADQEYGGRWRVKSRNLRSGNEDEEIYDAVIVANGHFVVPHVPDIPGIKEWNANYPGAISHSKYFRKPEDFAGKKVVVKPLLWSSRSVSFFNPSKVIDPRKREHRPIARFLPESRGVEFEDGAIEHDVDAVLFATGYYYSLPFLKHVEPALITDGSHVHHTYQHLFYAPRPTISFLVLNQRVIPFPMAEVQSAVLARAYSGRLPLPPLAEMQQWEENAIAENGNGKNFHLLPFPRDGQYLNKMSDWAMMVPPREGLENDGKGRIPPRWGKWEFWCRDNFAAIRGAFGARGEERHKVRSIEELGFVQGKEREHQGEENRII
ncbi:FAD/NAD(P)-binding domain-containing protein [Westerdykella ornata]|uniref:FAD/NAD(P)-binding domain-containing protein n=1 Tax=Westerdykella ornata TaxID=318751 RepID=A0A6A6JVY0_WESOR|nr:FAD/NAD(P)-binding domain-containing protein [Westerdykella ornata]KAF2279876.1 FAD/NAD(P)-binding domain-containing protein [Westerdykella ornata]